MSALDAAARGMAAQTRARFDRNLVLGSLRRGIARAGGMLPSLSASPPTIGTPGASTLTGTLWGPVTYPDRYTFLRGFWGASGTTFPLTLFYKATAVNGSSGSTASGTAPVVRFWCGAPDLEIESFGTGSATTGGYRLRVDGQYVQTGCIALNGTAGSGIYARITWGDGSAAYRKPRLYEIEGLSSWTFGGVKTAATDAPWAAPIADALRVIVHGDSFVDGTGSTPGMLHGPLGAQIGLLLGQADTAASGVGGTGYIATSSGTRNTFGQRVQSDIVDHAPDVVIELGGINDEGSVGDGGATLQAAVTSWLAAVVGALPDVLIFMTGPQTPGNPTASRNTVRNVKQAAAALYPRNVVFIDNIAENWVTGTGKVSTPAANGNADWVTGGVAGTDPTHPTDAGHSYLASRVVAAIAARIPAA